MNAEDIFNISLSHAKVVSSLVKNPDVVGFVIMVDYGNSIGVISDSYGTLEVGTVKE